MMYCTRGAARKETNVRAGDREHPDEASILKMESFGCRERYLSHKHLGHEKPRS